MISYSEGWDETYVDNFLLNRYCNMRITDETLYYAMKLKDGIVMEINKCVICFWIDF